MKFHGEAAKANEFSLDVWNSIGTTQIRPQKNVSPLTFVHQLNLRYRTYHSHPNENAAEQTRTIHLMGRRLLLDGYPSLLLP